MNQFNIFLDFYRIIAEMTEEEIVSAIGSPKYRNTVESVRRIFLEQQGRRIIFFTIFSFAIPLLYYCLLVYYHLFLSIVFLIFIRYIKT